MKKILFYTLFVCISFLSIAQTPNKTTENRVISVIDSSQVNNMVLKQSFVVNVALDSVWNAYTTKKGWESWATSIAEIDFMILFEKIAPSKTKIISYGIGYKKNEKYKSLMKFFIQENEQSYLNLISYLETGNPSVKY